MAIQKNAIDVCVLKNRYIEEALANIIFRILKIHNLQNRLLIIIINNTCNNNTFRNLLTKILQAKDIIYNTNLRTINCINYIIQLTISILFKTLKI